MVSHVETVRSYVGTPFHWHGRFPRVGLDCVGVVVCLLREHLNSAYDFLDYGPTNLPGAVLLSELVGLGFEEVSGPEVGLLTVINIRRHPRHLAVLTGEEDNLSMVHTWESHGRVVEHGFQDQWKEWAASFWRFPWQL